MFKVLCGVSVLAICSSAGARGFAVSLADAGGITGSVGHPITWTGPGGGPGRAPFQASSSRTAPSADDIDGNPKLRFDDYFGLDPNGQSTGGDPNVKDDGYSSNHQLVVVDSFDGSHSGFAAGSAFGVWGSVSPIGSGPIHSGVIQDGGGGESLFLMNLTLRAGDSAPTTDGLLVQLLNYSHPAGEFVALTFGWQNPTIFGGFAYYLTWEKSTVTAAQTNATFAGGTNYQIYIVESILGPSPGPVSLGAAASMLGLRRRRA